MYAFVRGLLEGGEEEGEEGRFELRFFEKGGRGLRVVPGGGGGGGGGERLVGELGMRGRVLVTFAWAAGAGGSGGVVLKREFRERARELEVREVEGREVGEEKAEDAGVEKEAGEKGSGSGRKGGVPKWLKLPGKK